MEINEAYMGIDVRFNVLLPNLARIALLIVEFNLIGQDTKQNVYFPLLLEKKNGSP